MPLISSASGPTVARALNRPVLMTRRSGRLMSVEVPVRWSGRGDWPASGGHSSSYLHVAGITAQLRFLHAALGLR